VDPYRAHRAVFDAVSVPQLLQAFRQITGQTRQAGFNLPSDVFASLRDGLFQSQQLILVFGVHADLELFSKNLALYDKNLSPANIDKLIPEFCTQISYAAFGVKLSGITSSDVWFKKFRY